MSEQPTDEASRQVRQFITVYECDTCTYEAYTPDRNRHHYPRDEPARLPGQPPRKKCPGTVLEVTYMRYVAHAMRAGAERRADA